ncbi:MAG: hypothetical protein IJF49_04155 [Clostridia bacterium]|nr:hypothetical protein [Clostridia bacterium]
MFWVKEKEKVNYGKIIAISVSIVLGVVALAAIAYKLWEKYCPCLCDACCDDLLDEFDCDYCEDDDAIECTCCDCADEEIIEAAE